MLKLSEVEKKLKELFADKPSERIAMMDWLTLNHAFLDIPLPAQSRPYLATLPLSIQGQIILFVKECNERRMSPSLQEVADHTGRSKTSVNYHISQLCKKGILEHDRNKQRTLRIAGSR